jgi:putative MATE family efflux protein
MVRYRGHMRLPDRIFWKSLLRIAIPVIIQNFVTSFLNMIDIIMVGQLGETAVAGVGLANQIPFILTLFFFGINSGSATLTAQLWGKGDKVNIRKMAVMCLTISMLGGLCFSLIALIIPAQTLQLYTLDQDVVRLGSRYLRLSGISFLMMSISLSYSAMLKSTGIVKPQMYISFVALGTKTFLNYLFIFGNFGLPRLGTEGAAMATIVSRLIEMGAILFVVYGRHSDVAVQPADWMGIKQRIFTLYLKTALPAMFNELFWAMGISVYNVIYAHISTEAIAAYNIIGSIENVAFVIFVGISDACGVLVGNKIGAGHEDEAFDYARWMLGIIVCIAAGIGGLIYICRGLIISVYNVEDITRSYVNGFLTIMACILWLRTSLMTLVVGIMRSGGDTRFALVVDSGLIWVLGVPMAALGAFVLHVPVVIVYLMASMEEIIKFFVCVYRFISKKWIHNLAQRIENDLMIPENADVLE